MGEKQLRALGDINALRKNIIEPIETLRESIKDASGKKCAEIIYNYLRSSGADERLKEYALTLETQGLNELATEQEQVWDILMEILDELAMSLGDRGVSVKRFLELFEIVVSSKSLGKLPDGYDEVAI
jgi:ATP-dependent helicase/nuclease subunit B